MAALSWRGHGARDALGHRPVGAGDFQPPRLAVGRRAAPSPAHVAVASGARRAGWHRGIFVHPTAGAWAAVCGAAEPWPCIFVSQRRAWRVGHLRQFAAALMVAMFQRRPNRAVRNQAGVPVVWAGRVGADRRPLRDVRLCRQRRVAGRGEPRVAGRHPRGRDRGGSWLTFGKRPLAGPERISRLPGLAGHHRVATAGRVFRLSPQGSHRQRRRGGKSSRWRAALAQHAHLRAAAAASAGILLDASLHRALNA